MDRVSRKELELMFGQLCESRYFQETLSNNDFGGYLDFGEEAITIGSLAGINEDDYISNYFRGDGAVLRYRGVVTLQDEMAWWFGKATGSTPVTSVVPTNWSAVDYGVIGATSACLGGDADLCCGVALAQKLQKTGRVMLFLTGDGATSKGNFHEVFTMASLQKLPIIFVMRANGWAMSTPTEKAIACKHVSDMAQAYGMPSSIIDGNDVLSVREEVLKAANYARSGNGPVMIEAATYRMAAHSSRDEDNYRSDEEKKQWAAKDPVLKTEKIMLEYGYTEDEINSIKNDIKAAVTDAFEKSKLLPAMSMDDVLEKEMSIVNLMWGRR